MQIVHGQDAFTYSDFGVNWNGTCRSGVHQSPINFRDSLFSRTAIPPPVPNGTFGTGTNVTVSLPNACVLAIACIRSCVLVSCYSRCCAVRKSSRRCLPVVPVCTYCVAVTLFGQASCAITCAYVEAHHNLSCPPSLCQLTVSPRHSLMLVRLKCVLCWCAQVHHLGNQIKVTWTQVAPSTVKMTLGAFYAQPNATGIIKVPGTDADAGPADTVMTVSPVQFHFHTNSEHTFDGRYSVAETHLVTNVTAANTSCPVSKPCTAVYGILYDYSSDGITGSDFLEPILANIPDPMGTTTATTNLGSALTLNLTSYFPDETSKYIQYQGSFTTPPCTEGVLWTVYPETRPISFNETLQLSQAFTYAVTQGVIPTRTDNRFPQQINNRTVWYFDTTAGPTTA